MRAGIIFWMDIVVPPIGVVFYMQRARWQRPR
jgi:hypothetical protein